MRRHRAFRRLALLAAVLVPVAHLGGTAVASAAEPAVFSSTTAQGSLYNVTTAIGARTLWSAGYTGRGIDVAVIDTGISPVPSLSQAGKVVNGPDVSFDGTVPELSWLDGHGHGTHMAGIIAGKEGTGAVSATADPERFLGVAPDARLLNVKVGDNTGAVDVSQVIAALDWIVEHRRDNGLNVRVINLSFGTSGVQPYLVDPLARAVERAWNSGIVVVVAAGNDGRALYGLATPASDPFVITVGAAERTATGAWTSPSFASNGNGLRNPDLVAPGRSIASLRVPGSRADVEHGVTGYVNEQLFLGSGSSQAAAAVSGGVALLLEQRPNLTPNQVKALLTKTADKMPGVSTTRQGNGLIDLAGASKASTPLALFSAPAPPPLHRTRPPPAVSRHRLRRRRRDPADRRAHGVRQPVPAVEAEQPDRQRRFVGWRFVGWWFVGWWFVGWWFVGWWFVGWWFVGWWFVGWWFVGWWFVGWWFVGRRFVGRWVVGRRRLVVTSEQPDHANRTGSPRRPVRLAVAFGLALAGGSAAIVALLPATTRGTPIVPFLVVLVGFALTELWLSHFQIRRESYAFSVGEVPFVLGLAFLSPVSLIGARLLGAGAAGLRRRLPAYKLHVNLCLFAFESAVALTIVERLGGAPGTVRYWSLIVVAVFAAGLTNGLAMALVITMFQRNAFRHVLAMASQTQLLYLLNACLGVLVAVGAATSWWIAAFGLLPIGGLWLATNLYGQMQKRYEHLDAVYQFTSTIGRSDPDDVLPVAITEIQRLLNVEFVELRLAGHGTTAPLRLALSDDGRGEVEVLPSETGASAALLDLDSVCVLDRADEISSMLGVTQHPINGCLVAPILSDNTVIGVIIAANRLGLGGGFKRDDIAVASAVVNHLAVVLQSSLLVRQLETLSVEDSLTGLLNSNGLERAIADGQLIADDQAVIVVELDEFKEINESLGRAVGDELLLGVARRLVDLAGDGARVARLGGNEFAVVIGDVTDDAIADDWAERTLLVLRPGFEHAGLSIGVIPMVGIARAAHGATEFSTVLRRAASAAADAKRDGRSWMLHRGEQDRDGRRRLVLAAALRRALDSDGLTVRFQPKIDIASGRAIGAEALVRWSHPRIRSCAAAGDRRTRRARRSDPPVDRLGHRHRAARDQVAAPRWARGQRRRQPLGARPARP